MSSSSVSKNSLAIQANVPSPPHPIAAAKSTPKADVAKSNTGKRVADTYSTLPSDAKLRPAQRVELQVPETTEGRSQRELRAAYKKKYPRVKLGQETRLVDVGNLPPDAVFKRMLDFDTSPEQRAIIGKFLATHVHGVVPSKLGDVVPRFSKADVKALIQKTEQGAKGTQDPDAIHAQHGEVPLDFIARTTGIQRIREAAKAFGARPEEVLRAAEIVWRRENDGKDFVAGKSFLPVDLNNPVHRNAVKHVLNEGKVAVEEFKIGVRQSSTLEIQAAISRAQQRPATLLTKKQIQSEFREIDQGILADADPKQAVISLDPTDPYDSELATVALNRDIDRILNGGLTDPLENSSLRTHKIRAHYAERAFGAGTEKALDYISLGTEKHGYTGHTDDGISNEASYSELRASASLVAGVQAATVRQQAKIRAIQEESRERQRQADQRFSETVAAAERRVRENHELRVLLDEEHTELVHKRVSHAAAVRFDPDAVEPA